MPGSVGLEEPSSPQAYVPHLSEPCDIQPAYQSVCAREVEGLKRHGRIVEGRRWMEGLKVDEVEEVDEDE
jgi:hypothetical protein